MGVCVAELKKYSYFSYGMNICRTCKEVIPNRVVLKGVAHNLSSRRHCLKCLPFKGKRLKYSQGADKTRKVCPRT